ncbi:proline dipeptidase [Salmonella enterica subsp. enterica]|uniref:Proline dipeptidase n=1 Tax=Salmonella enterica I TaxID=59201 RepID=A0A447N0Y4_SALET|nr:proline dipeptidase [Salmonella enterica subsp. enterica]
MESLAALYKNHIVTLQERTRDVLARFKLDALLIHSGELFNVFLDDHPYPFKVNPQFKAWVPVTQVPNCWLLVDGVNKPKLWFYLPVDYWHNVEPLPTSFWTEEVEVVALPKADGIGSQLPAARGNIGYIGPVPERALQLDIAASNINPKGVIDYLHYYRAYKTDYELACMREAQKMAVSGHRGGGRGLPFRHERVRHQPGVPDRHGTSRYRCSIQQHCGAERTCRRAALHETGSSGTV